MSNSALHLAQTDPPLTRRLSLCLQVQLYEDFAKSRAKVGVEDTISTVSTQEEEKPKLKATGHVFQVHTHYVTAFVVFGLSLTMKGDFFSTELLTCECDLH